MTTLLATSAETSSPRRLLGTPVDEPEGSMPIELGVYQLPEELAEWADCGLCGAPNGADREECLSCGASLHQAPDTAGGPPSPGPAVWLSTQFLDAGARHALAQILSCGMG